MVLVGGSVSRVISIELEPVRMTRSPACSQSAQSSAQQHPGAAAHSTTCFGI